MASVASSLGEAARLNVPVRLSGFVIGALMPFTLYFSTKSTTLFAGVAALLAFWGLWREGRWPDIRAGWRAPAGPVVALSALLFAYLAASAIWSRFPDTALLTFAEIVVALAVSVAFGLCYRVLLPYRFGFGIACGLIASATYALLEFRLGLTLRTLLGLRAYPFVFNRSIVYQVMLIWPMLLLAERRDRWLAAIAIAMVALAAAVSDSGAAVLGLVCGCLALALASVASRVALRLGAAVATVAVALAPWLGALIERLMPPALGGRLGGAHAAERIGIWRAFGEFFEQNLLFGAGLGASSRALEHPAAQGVSEGLRPMLANNHPHNAFLQVWVELGLVGAVLVAALIVAVFLKIDAAGRRHRIHATALAASALAITAVSHGAWQAWWLTTVSAMAAIFWASNEEDDGVYRG